MSTATLSERPAPEAPVALAPGIVLHPPLADGADSRMVELPDRRLTRVSDDIGRLLDVLSERPEPATPEHLAARLGAPWTPAAVAETRRRLDALGITGPGRRAPGLRVGRLEYRPPMSLQLTLLDPARILGRVRPGSRLLTASWPPLVALVLAAAGLPIVLAALTSVSSVLHAPAGLATYGLVLAGLLATVAIHELAHGAVLAAHGGRPRRFGVMLFYLLPAFFCDVSDAWRLTPRARVRVAMAGIVVQVAIAGAAALASLAAAGDVRQGLIVFSLLCYVYGLANLIPFLKLDGYLALAGGLDIPHLRRKAMDDAQSWLAHVLFGARVERSLPDLSWARWFGAVCTLVPLLVIGSALSTLGPALLGFGVIGAVLALLLVLALGVAGVRALTGFLGRALRGGAGRARTLSVAAALVVAVAAALAFVQVPRTLHGGYSVVDGTPAAVLGAGLPAGALEEGTSVEIRRNGLLPGAVVATATVAGEARECTAPLAAQVPVRDERYTLAAQCVPLKFAGPAPAVATGRLSVTLPQRPVADRLAELFLDPSLTALGIAR